MNWQNGSISLGGFLNWKIVTEWPLFPQPHTGHQVILYTNISSAF